MANLFVVTKSGYEYNDETYHRNSGGKPLKAWKSEADAEADCLRQNLQELRKSNIRDYCYSLNEILKKDLIKELTQNYGISEDDDSISFKDLPDEILIRVLKEGRYKSHPLIFFEVYEVEMGK